jgi:hypothetical protein
MIRQVWIEYTYSNCLIRAYSHAGNRRWDRTTKIPMRLIHPRVNYWVSPIRLAAQAVPANLSRFGSEISANRHSDHAADDGSGGEFGKPNWKPWLDSVSAEPPSANVREMALCRAGTGAIICRETGAGIKSSKRPWN